MPLQDQGGGLGKRLGTNLAGLKLRPSSACRRTRFGTPKTIMGMSHHPRSADNGQMDFRLMCAHVRRSTISYGAKRIM